MSILNRPATVTVIVGPTAVGKGTVVAKMLELAPQIWLSISVTTREPRLGELDGVHYHFTTKEKFEQMIAQGEILEYAIVHGQNYYGTPKQPVEEALKLGRPVIIELDLQGARQIRKSLPQAKQVFLAPPSWEEIKRRLEFRASESPSEQARRLQTAKVEIAAQDEFDEVFINEDVTTTAHQLLHFMGVEDYNS